MVTALLAAPNVSFHITVHAGDGTQLYSEQWVRTNGTMNVSSVTFTLGGTTYTITVRNDGLCLVESASGPTTAQDIYFQLVVDGFDMGGPWVSGGGSVSLGQGNSGGAALYAFSEYGGVENPIALPHHGYRDFVADYSAFSTRQCFGLHVVVPAETGSGPISFRVEPDQGIRSPAITILGYVPEIKAAPSSKFWTDLVELKRIDRLKKVYDVEYVPPVPAVSYRPASRTCPPTSPPTPPPSWHVENLCGTATVYLNLGTDPATGQTEVRGQTTAYLIQYQGKVVLDKRASQVTNDSLVAPFSSQLSYTEPFCTNVKVYG